jgi:putative methionine-R-sulfoxide reductase with GAF domain/CHASE3 domain sensor protein
MTRIKRFFATSIRRRILAGFVIVTALVLTMAVATFSQLSQVRTYSEQIIPDSSQMGHLQSLGLATFALDADLERFLLIRGAEYRDSALQDLANMTSALDKLRLDAGTGAGTDDLESLQNLQDVIARLETQVGALLDTDSGSAATDINQRIVALYADIEQVKGLQQELSADELAQLQAAAATQGRITSEVITQIAVLGFIVLAIAVGASLVINRTMRPISDLTETATAIAAGDLNRAALVQSQDEIGTLATAFNQMTGQLRGLIGGLEQRVAERTRALATSTEVSRRLSTILDREQLIREVVEQMQSAFGYYHTQIYLVDPTGKSLVMAGGTGEAGAVMVARGHSLPTGKGLVGRAAETNTIVLVSNTSANAEWLPNPLLPETKSELAVPIALGDEVIGVLDVQHNVTDGLTQNDADVIQAVANQVAIALQNSRSYAVAQRHAERESLINTIAQQIQSTTTIDGALQIAARELGRATGASHTYVQLNVSGSKNGQKN